MNKSYLLIAFGLLTFVALAIMFYPLRKNKRLAFSLAIFFLMAIMGGYWCWGGWQEWQNYLLRELQQKQIQTALATIKSPQDLIAKLKTHLQVNPQSARGWYLLGRLYASQNQWVDARNAFSKLRSLRPQDEEALLNYVQSEWQLNSQQFNKRTRELVSLILQKNPQQADVLAMVAIDAFRSKDYLSAIDYWQRLLLLTPQLSSQAQTIRKAIAKAQDKLNHAV